MTLDTGRIYGDGSSSIGTQFTDHYYQKKALVELQKEKYFSQLADTTNLPKNMGKTIKRYHYVPLLDDRNVNDQGIDANGVAMAATQFAVTIPQATNGAPLNTNTLGTAERDYVEGEYLLCVADTCYYVIGAAGVSEDDDLSAVAGATAKTYAEIKALIEDTLTGTTAITATVDINGIDVTNQTPVYETEAKATIVTSIIGGSAAVERYGNLYGSSKDIGTVQGKLPVLSETGGQVNRIGFTRSNLEGSIEKFGFYEKYTQESIDFDTDAELSMHINREMLFGANELTEDMLQIDLLENAGVEYFPGAATVDTLEELTGETGSITEVSYADLIKLDIELTNNRCPKSTKIITGSRLTDTKVIPAARIMYIGSEMQPTLLQMTDYHSNQAFIPLAHYAAAGSEINGEIGTVANFRVVVVPEMMHHAGVGAAVSSNAGYRYTNGRYDAYPLLVVGSESFTTIGFQTAGKTVKYKIYHKPPGEKIADLSNPYGEEGFMSIKFYYGFMPLRTERLAVIWSVAQM